MNLIFFQGIFGKFDTEYKRLKYFKSRGLFISPQTIVIGTELRSSLIDSEVTLYSKAVDIQFIKLTHIFKLFFEQPNVYKKTVKYIDTLTKDMEEKVLSNFTVGEVWQKKLQSLSYVDLMLPLFLYFDEFEPGNPLGSHAGKQKLGAVYVTIPCLPQEYLSSTKAIFLVLLFNYQFRIKYGNSKTFNSLIEELHFLETTGIKVIVGDSVKTIRFSLALILGDNLGMHSLLGMTESFSSTYYCRFCKSPKQICKFQCTLDPNTIRNRDSYDEDVQNDLGLKEPCI